MDKELALQIIKLLSAIESWCFAKDRGMLPDYLHDHIQDVVEKLSKEILG